MLVPSKRIVALMMPQVMELADGTVLDIVAAIEYVEQIQKEQGQPVKLLGLLKVIQECAIALARVRFHSVLSGSGAPDWCGLTCLDARHLKSQHAAVHPPAQAHVPRALAVLSAPNPTGPGQW